MTILVRVTEYFGRVTIVPLDENAKLFAELLKQTTLTQGDVEVIKKLGVEVKVKEPEL